MENLSIKNDNDKTHGVGERPKAFRDSLAQDATGLALPCASLTRHPEPRCSCAQADKAQGPQQRDPDDASRAPHRGSSSQLTIEDIRQAVERTKNLPQSTVDIVVIYQPRFVELRKAIEERRFWAPLFAWANCDEYLAYLGLTVLVEPSPQATHKTALKLADAGKRVMEIL